MISKSSMWNIPIHSQKQLWNAHKSEKRKKEEIFYQTNKKKRKKKNPYKQQQQKIAILFWITVFHPTISPEKGVAAFHSKTQKKNQRLYNKSERKIDILFVKGRLFPVYLSYCICIFFWICCGVCVSADFPLRFPFKTALFRDLKHLKKQEKSFQQMAYRLKQQKLWK